MRILTNVEYMDVPYDMHEIMHKQWRPKDLIECNKYENGQEVAGFVEAETFKLEMVKGKRYCFADGREIVLGLPEDIERALWLDYNQQKETEIQNNKLLKLLDGQLKEKEKYITEIKEIKELTWYQRIGKVFTGYEAKQ